MKALLILLAAPACIGLPNELELFASRYQGEQDLAYHPNRAQSGDADGYEFGAALKFPITYPGLASAGPPGHLCQHAEPRDAGLVADPPPQQLEVPAEDPGIPAPEPEESEVEPEPTPADPEDPEHDHGEHDLWYESEMFLRWIERILLVIITALTTLGTKKGYDVHAERKRRK